MKKNINNNIKIGNTPMIKIRYQYNGNERYVYAKLEAYNYSGSIKDRVAYYIIKKAYETGELKKGMTIVEATSGNTGIALAAIGKLFANPVKIFMPDWVSKERSDILKSYDADVVLISKKDGGFLKALEKAEKYAKENNGFYSRQFENQNNLLAHYETTGEEILNTMKGEVGGFVSGIGTGGTLIGVAKKLKENNSNTKIYALEPDKMPLISQNRIIGDHKIEGIGDEFIPKIVDRKLIDKTILINDDDAINMARKIYSDLKIGVGISSGANILASIIANEENNGNIVTVFPDDNKKYLSTDLSKNVDNNPNYLSNKVKLIDYIFVK